MIKNIDLQRTVIYNLKLLSAALQQLVNRNHYVNYENVTMQNFRISASCKYNKYHRKSQVLPLEW